VDFPFIIILLTHIFHIVSELWASEVRIGIGNPFTDKKLLILSNFQTDFGAHLPFYSVGAMNIFQGIKRPKRENYHPYPSSAKGAIEGAAPLSELRVFSSLKNFEEN